ncbi:hypothetical protein [Sandaracinus amylolyticus]|uniref:hypothetical protein n=1 Tax=Sandaracinus amylolyticus TaxID=927083 RepID=UPI001F26C4BA|nr:hypothetical protein [Sandaracinus amylolyticus]UJR79439.1 Hypothetical protein I5071_14750 [Sandaracinus amylolyticus]
MRRLLALVTCLGACAPDPSLRASELATATTVGTDERPTNDVALRLREGVAYVDRDARLVVIDGEGREHAIGDEVLAPPITDGARLVWCDERATIFELRDAQPIALAHAPGPMAPLAILEDGSIALVGSTNGGVAGLWLFDDELRCLTNCALRVGRPWGDAYTPPPAGASIHLEGAHVVFVGADGATHRVPR